MRIPYETMVAEFIRVLLKKGFTPERADLCARLFAGASLDGVYTHGLNRFPRFISNIDAGYVKVDAEPVLAESVGSLERWDGMLGPGNLNAHFCMNRAIELARRNGVGCVAIRNTNHWMRAGSYGLQAIEAGCVGICWTNTMPNMPPWGGTEAKIGNNPLVLAVSGPKGPILLDMAVSMFSYGKLESYALHDELLPVEGGFDEDNHLTKDPKQILKTRRVLPVGYWKGSGLSLLLDLVAVALSGGLSTRETGEYPVEMGLSQVFIAFNTSGMSGQDAIAASIRQAIEDLHATHPAQPGGKVLYPGERMMQTRKTNLELGIPVDEVFWEQVLKL